MLLRKGGYSSKQINYLIEEGSRFINDNPEIVKGIYKELSYNDDPKLYRYAIHFKDKYDDEKNEDAGGAGVAFDKKRALLKVLGETIERYSLSGNNDKKFTYKSFNELIALDKSVLDLENLILFSNKRLHINNLYNKKFHWAEGRSLISNKKKLIPAQLIWV